MILLGVLGFGVLVKISLSPYPPISLSPNSYGSCLVFY
ncbi:hypothetical protein C789_4605 [Microcystis aeruginosa FACHB-905 = DIANCHI905]|uniref:Uncharacterized protein n=1 Tax=Microcystis aeruginosa PCC 7806SL TaxID=1903187 RepID=A0AB33C3Z5_MICA7|nr:hypothetical protein BH695_3808 [Microcystis aeruginosa PCC 7806SL]ELS45613.1 hypothetical protein C789_4605 [Microcystis aeruginosa FACHB-905 = DIANCHI905]